MVETVDIRDSRTGATVRCYYVLDAVVLTGYSRKTLERHVAKGTLTRLYHRGHTVHPVAEIEQIRELRDGDRPGGAPPPPKPRPNPRGGAR
jgi:hypothetical protein